MAHKRAHKVSKKERERRRAISRGVRRSNRMRFLAEVEMLSNQGFSTLYMAHHFGVAVPVIRSALKELARINAPIVARLPGRFTRGAVDLAIRGARQAIEPGLNELRERLEEK